MGIYLTGERAGNCEAFVSASIRLPFDHQGLQMIVGEPSKVKRKYASVIYRLGKQKFMPAKVGEAFR